MTKVMALVTSSPKDSTVLYSVHYNSTQSCSPHQTLQALSSNREILILHETNRYVYYEISQSNSNNISIIWNILGIPCIFKMYLVISLMNTHSPFYCPPSLYHNSFVDSSSLEAKMYHTRTESGSIKAYKRLLQNNGICCLGYICNHMSICDINGECDLVNQKTWRNKKGWIYCISTTIWSKSRSLEQKL